MKLTISQAAIEFGHSKDTITRVLREEELKTGKGTTFTIRQIHSALSGDFRRERTRLTRAQADEQEHKNKIAAGQMIPLEENLKWQRRVLEPIRARLLSLSGSVSHLANPSDPAHAAGALDRWVNESLSLLREEIQKAGK